MIVGMASDPDGAASIAWTDSSTLLIMAVKLLGATNATVQDTPGKGAVPVPR